MTPAIPNPQHAFLLAGVQNAYPWSKPGDYLTRKRNIRTPPSPPKINKNKKIKITTTTRGKFRPPMVFSLSLSLTFLIKNLHRHLEISIGLGASVSCVIMQNFHRAYGSKGLVYNKV